MVRLILGGFIGLFVGVTASAQEGNKAAVPSEAEQARASALVAELYELPKSATSKDAAALARAAQLLLAEGRDTNDDPAGRYVLFLKAHALAAQAGDVPTAIQALEEVDRHFSFDAKKLYTMKLGALKTAAQSVAGPELHQIVVDTALVLLQVSRKSGGDLREEWCRLPCPFLAFLGVLSHPQKRQARKPIYGAYSFFRAIAIRF